MKRQYLEKGEDVFCTGTWLIWNGKSFDFSAESFDGDTYYDGMVVIMDDKGKPYVEVEDDKG